MKITKAKEKALSPAKKDYSRESKRQQQLSVQLQNDWAAFQKKAAELSSSHKANIIIMAHFPDSSSKLPSMQTISAHGPVARKYQSKDMLQLLASKFEKKCSEGSQTQEEGDSSMVESQANQEEYEGPQTLSVDMIPYVTETISNVIDTINTDANITTTIVDPASWPGKVDEIEIMEEDDVPETPAPVPTTPGTLKSNLTSPKSTEGNASPRVVTLSNFSPTTVVKCYSASKNKENSSRRILQAVQLRPKPLEKPVFHANGHTYASLDDGTVIKVVPVQFTREETRIVQEDEQNEEELQEDHQIMMHEETEQPEDGRSSASSALAGCVEVIMSTELTQAIEAMNNDVLAPLGTILTRSDSTVPSTMDGGASSSSCSDSGPTKAKRGRPRNPGTVVTVTMSEGNSRASRNDRANYKFKCTECSRLFRDSFDLKVHTRTHTGEKPFKCDECEQSFSLKCTLKVHQLLHTGERPYQCDQCDKAFTRSDYLTRHLTHHTGEKPFTCPVKSCNKTFALRSRLNKHQRSLNHFEEATDPLTTSS